MFLLFPIWVRAARFPQFTAVLIILNLVIFLVLWPVEKRLAGTVGSDQWEETVSKLCAIVLHKESDLPAEMRTIIQDEKKNEPFPSEYLVGALKRIQENPMILSAKSRYKWGLVYPLFLSYENTVKEKSLGNTPYRNYGFRPDRGWWIRVFTHQFLHDGLFHLVFNMLFLWIMGCVLEDRMGINILWLYLGGGAVAAWAQVWWGIKPGVVMVGASGAISTLMGFSLFFMPQAKVKLWYFLMVSLYPRTGVLDTSLWFYLPIWLLDQTLMGLASRASDYASVGYGAHLGGFFIGAIAALTISKFLSKGAVASA